jgi:hypothetical protein
LEENTDKIPKIEYEFGEDGKPSLYVKTRAELNRYLPTLQKAVGDNYQYYVAEEDDEYDDEYDDFEYDEYDDDDEYYDDDDECDCEDCRLIRGEDAYSDAELLRIIDELSKKYLNNDDPECDCEECRLSRGEEVYDEEEEDDDVWLLSFFDSLSKTERTRLMKNMDKFEEMLAEFKRTEDAAK